LAQRLDGKKEKMPSCPCFWGKRKKKCNGEDTTEEANKATVPSALSGSSGSIFQLTPLEHKELEKHHVIPNVVLKKIYKQNSNEILSEYYYSHLLHTLLPGCFYKPIYLEQGETTTLYIPKIHGKDGYDFSLERFPPNTVTLLIVAFLDQMQALQQLGVSHYDMNHGNVMFSPHILEQCGYKVRLIDFGYTGYNVFHKSQYQVGSMRAPELMWSEMTPGTPEASEAWTWALTALGIFFPSQKLHDLLDLREQAKDNQVDVIMWGTTLEETTHKVKNLLLLAWEDRWESSYEVFQLLSKCLNAFSLCLVLDPQKRGTLDMARRILTDQSILTTFEKTSPVVAFHVPLVFKSLKDFKVPTQYQEFILILKNNTLRKRPLGIILAAINLYLALCSYCFTKKEPLEIPSYVWAETIISMIQRILLKETPDLTVDHFTPKHHTIERFIVKRLDWHLIYEPWAVTSFTPTDVLTNKQFKALVPILLNLETYESQAVLQ